MRFTPRGRKPVATAAAALLTGLALAAFTPTTAHADETLDASLAFHDVVVTPGAEREYLYLELHSEPADLDIWAGYELTVDFSEIAGWATLGMQEGNPDCSVEGAVFTCAGRAFISGGESHIESFKITVPESATPVQQGSIHFTYSLEGYEMLTYESSVTLAHPTDLVGGEYDGLEVAYGSTFDGAMTVTNTGDTPVEGVTVLIDTARFTEVVDVPSNCSAPHKRYTYCFFDEMLQPGATYKIEGISIAVTDDAVAPGRGYLSHQWHTNADFAVLPYQPDLGEPGTAAPATLVEQAGLRSSAHSDTDPENNYGGGWLAITGDNPLDAEIAETAVVGSIGDEVEAVVEVTNVSNASFKNDLSGDDVFAVRIEIPEGTTAVAVPESCFVELDEWEWEYGVPGYDEYECNTDMVLTPGGKFEYPFTLRIDEDVTDSAGDLEIFKQDGGGELIDLDHNAANNSAKLVVNPTDAPGDGSLPVTGVALSWWIGGGAVVLVAGVVGVVLMRRRAAVATW